MIIYIVILVVAVVILLGAKWLLYGMGKIKTVSIDEVDLSKIPDGVYKGSYSRGRWKYNVEVAVKDHRIENVRLLDNKMAMFEKINKEEIDRILQKQSLKVDTVTSATVTCKALLKSVENALRQKA